MRLFTAIDLSDEVRAHIEILQSKLKPAARIHWSPAYNLHITLKFIGEWSQQRLEELTTVLRTISPVGPIAIAVHGIQWFPSQYSPRAFCVGVEAPQTLHDLAKATDAAVSALGVTKEQRAYSPHLTLARIRTPQPLPALHQAIANLASQDFGRFTAAQYHLYRSEQTSAGPIYTKLSDFPLIP